MRLYALASITIAMVIIAHCKPLPPSEPAVVEAGPGGKECSGVWAKDPALGAVCIAVEDLAPFIPLILAKKACHDGGCLSEAGK